MDDDFPGAGDVKASPLFVGTEYHIRCFSVNSIVRSAGIFLFLFQNRGDFFQKGAMETRPDMRG